MDKTWIVCCQVEHKGDDGWSGSRQVQTFNLDPRFVGEDRKHVEMMARGIVNVMNDVRLTVHVSAELV